MSIEHRLVIEVDVELLDGSWTEQDLIENAVYFFQLAIDRAQRENDAAHSPAYAVNTNDICVWTQGGYAEDHQADLAT
jgi:hypothetical protein